VRYSLAVWRVYKTNVAVEILTGKRTRTQLLAECSVVVALCVDGLLLLSVMYWHGMRLEERVSER